MKKLDIDTFQQLNISGFAYELLRNKVIPNLLGDEIGPILYWEGKNLARNFQFTSFEEIATFFENAGWGTLEIKSTKKNSLEFKLTSELITQRSKEKSKTCYQLEAGFLAQQFEQLNNFVTEAYEHSNSRSSKIIFTVKWDDSELVRKVDNED